MSIVKTVLSKIYPRIAKNKPLVVFFSISLFLTFPILVQNGIPFKFDWVWPLFDLRQFWDGLQSGGSLGVIASIAKTGPAIFGLLGLIHFPPLVFFKLFIFFVHFAAGYGFYRFIRSRVESEAVAIISGLAYAFTPYIFIRTIIGFTWSLVAYVALPFFLSKYWQAKKRLIDYLLIGFLFSLIFGQTQAGIMVTLIITLDLIVALFGSDRINSIKNFFFIFFSLLVFALPWVIVMFFEKQSLNVVSGGSVTTLNFIASLPHSFRNMFMLSDHHITAGYFYHLSHNKFYLLGWLIVWCVSFCAIFNKNNRRLFAVFIVSSLIVLPFVKGPTGIFGRFYIWFYNHFPQIAIFRETYHFEFLYAIALCILFALGLDWLWQKIDGFKSKVESRKSKDSLQKLTSLLFFSLKAALAAGVIVIIFPYLTFNYAGYLKLQKIPQEYTDLHNYFEANKSVCTKIYYPPGLGFEYFNDDNTPAASNSNILAISLGVPYLTDAASVLSQPSDEMFYRNELVSQFYERNDSGQFASLLKHDAIDCVVVRTDLDTKYKDVSNLSKEADPVIVSKWENTDWLGLTRSKQGLELEKQFGEKIYIFKPETRDQRPETNSNFENSKLEKTRDLAIQQFNNKTIYPLPLTDWATEFAYYKDGWSRGRYDFWRKLLFAELRQDFIYTDKPNALLSGKIAQRGKYEVWARYLTGGTAGETELKIQTSIFKITKDQGPEKLVWRKLGDVNVEAGDSLYIKNIIGENAIADLVLVRKD